MSSRLKTEKRRGSVLIAALVCLLIVMMMLGGMLLTTVRRHRQLHRERDLRQCELLLAAGIERAARRAATEPAYGGETWSLPGAAIVGGGDGQVVIEVRRGANNPTQQVSVVAEYPLGGEMSIRRSSTFVPTSKTSQFQE